MKNLLKNDEFQLDEILFQGRNKSYGAYALRHDADRILTRSLFIGVALFGAFATTPLVVKSFMPEKKIVSGDDNSVHRIIPVQVLERKKEDLKPVQTHEQKTVKTVVSTVPTPSANAVKDQPPATIKESLDAVRGFEAVQGAPPLSQVQTPVVHPEAGAAENSVKPHAVDNSPQTVVDVEAGFVGGINAFRDKVVSGFDTGDFDGAGEKLSTVVTFIVEKDGSISSVKASGKDAAFNREAERAVRNTKGKWVPAKIKGQPVRSYFKFPVSMMFE